MPLAGRLIKALYVANELTNLSRAELSFGHYLLQTCGQMQPSAMAR